MSYFCQVCDREMMFKASVVYVDDYITCGAGPCKQRASKLHDAYLTALVAKEKEKLKEQEKPKGVSAEMVVVLMTKTPLITDSWMMVMPAEHPDWLKDPDLVAKLLEDPSLSASDSDDPDTWWRVLRSSEVEKVVEQRKVH